MSVERWWGKEWMRVDISLCASTVSFLSSFHFKTEAATLTLF